jgi:hypothetical protein
MNIYRLNSGELRSWRDRSARAEIKHRIFQMHGETQVRAPSGRILGTARAPEKSRHVPIERAVARGAHHAVSPAECICREWQKPDGKGGEHHPICVNKAHWEGQQAHSPDVLRERALLVSPVPEPALPSPLPLATSSSAPSVPAPPDPSDCVCREWAGAISEAHHQLCGFREAWEQAHRVKAPQLIELETGTSIREASAEEVEASRQKQDQDGVGAIELSDGKLYYVRHE